MSTRDLVRKVLPAVIVGILLIVVAIFVWIPPTGKLVCSLSSAPGDPQADYTFTIRFNFWKVNKVETKQVITSKNKDLLKAYEKEDQDAIEKYKSLDFFQRKVSIKGEKLTSVTTINYKKVDEDTLMELEGTVKGKNNNYKIGATKKMYEALGATCKYK